MSSNSSSGASASIALAASTMLPASPTISTHGNSASSRRSSRRARGSSSTIIAFICSLSSLGLRYANARERPIGLREIEVERRGAAEQQAQPLCRIAQADSRRWCLAGGGGARVLHFDDQCAVAYFSAEPQHTTLRQFGNPVLDRILHHGLQQHD